MKKQGNVRDSIIKTAIDLFKEKSFEEISVNEICAAAEVSRTSFYSCFSCKKDILMAVMREHSSFNNLNTAEMFALENDFERMIYILNFHIGIWDKRNVALCKTILTLGINENMGIFDFSHAYDHLYEKLILNCQRSGMIRNMSDPLTITSDCIQIAKGYIVDWCCTNGCFDLPFAIRAAAERLTDLTPEYRKCGKPV